MSKKWMKQALFLAYRNKGNTSPNPTVGAVLVSKEGEFISQACTQRSGSFHAERELLEPLDLNQTKGAILYVTLEPCCFYGKTPPCTDIIIEKQIGKVIIATLDPNTKVNGKGIELLKKAGVEIEIGLLEQDARAINNDFIFAIKNQTPFIFAKVALSLDGSMTSFTGESQWISNPKSRRFGHILRYRADGILVGANTVIKDNPILNARMGSRKKELYRVILDIDASIPLDYHVLADDLPTLWVIGKRHQNAPFIKSILSRKNKEVYFIDSITDFKELFSFLYKEKNIISLMVEGGSVILSELLKQNWLNMVFIFFGNMFFGQGLRPFAGNPINQISKAPRLQQVKIKPMDEQFLVYGYLK